VEHGYRQISHRAQQQIEALVVLLCNAPTVTARMIDHAVQLLRSDPSWDAVASVSAHGEYSPSFALRLREDNSLEPFIAIPKLPEIFFADALLWVLRPGPYFETPPQVGGWLTESNFLGRKVAPLVHEGYGDIDHTWQVPAVEDWLRRNGFSEDATPYHSAPEAPSVTLQRQPGTASERERRVLITTVPFGEPDRTPLDLLESAGIDYVINPLGRRFKENELAEVAGDFGVLIAGTEPITAQVMDAAPNLRLIARVGIGLDSVDLHAARERGICVSYTPEAPSPAVAELALGLMLDLLRHVTAIDRGLRGGAWQRFMGRRLDGTTVGVIGAGRVGKRVIRLIRGAFPSTRIVANDLSPDVDFGLQYQVEWLEKEAIFREADLITLHLPLTALTRGLIGEREMAEMKPGVLLVNTARGGLINERDLAQALRDGRIAGAAIDVFEQEPYAGELVSVSQCLLTCHLGSMTEDCRARMEIEATQEAVRFLKGEPLLQLVPEQEFDLQRLPL
jgi:D-3-phosphoglycerate dehydrogenase